MAAPGARVSIRHEDFDLGVEVAALRAGDGNVGAVATFVGTVRDRSDGLVDNPGGQTIAPGDTVRYVPFAELLR